MNDFIIAFYKHNKRKFIKIIFFCILAGLSKATLFLFTGNIVADLLANTEIKSNDFILYVFLLIVAVYSYKCCIAEVSILSKNISNHLLSNLFNNRLNLDFFYYEKEFRKSYVYELNAQAEQINSASESLVSLLVHSFLLVAFILFFICISLQVATFIILLIIIFIPMFISKKNKHILLIDNHDAIDGAISGIKEIKLDSKKHYNILSKFIQEQKIYTSLKFKDNFNKLSSYMLLSCSHLFLITLLVFFATEVAEISYELISQLILFLLALPTDFVEKKYLIDMGVKSLQFLTKQNKVVKENQSKKYSDLTLKLSNFKFLKFENIYFKYNDLGSGEGFSVGPFNFVFDKQRIHFIIGNNGSGKTTILKLISGLYIPNFGEIYVNENLIKYGQQTSLINTIFLDFYLFQETYYFSKEEVIKFNILLTEFGLEKKVFIVKQQLQGINDLSTGQKKRLAMIMAILEDKPIMILDEWAADQDPYFREYFYLKLLPKLKNLGKTIIAVSHDDRYYHVADKLHTLDYGKIVEN